MSAFLALRFLGGMASAMVLVFTSALLLDFVMDQKRPGLNAVVFAGVGVGITVSALLVFLLKAAGQSWSVLWLASGLVSAFGAIAASQMIPLGPALSAVKYGRRAPTIEPRLIRVILAYGLFGFGYVITATFLVALVRCIRSEHRCRRNFHGADGARSDAWQGTCARRRTTGIDDQCVWTGTDRRSKRCRVHVRSVEQFRDSFVFRGHSACRCCDLGLGLI